MYSRKKKMNKRKQKMNYVNSEEGYNILVEAGLTPVMIPANDKEVHFFIKNEVVWDKLFTAIRCTNLKGYLDLVPHEKWFEQLIISYNPKLQEVEVGGVKAYGVKYDPIINKGDKIPRVDQAMRALFNIIATFLDAIFKRFKIDDIR